MPKALQTLKKTLAAVALYAAVMAGFWGFDLMVRSLAFRAAAPPAPAAVAFLSSCDPACSRMFLPGLRKSDQLAYFDTAALHEDLGTADVIVVVLHDWSEISKVGFMSNANEMRATVERDHPDRNVVMLTLTMSSGKIVDTMLYALHGSDVTSTDMNCIAADVVARAEGLRPMIAWTLDRATCTPS